MKRKRLVQRVIAATASSALLIAIFQNCSAATAPTNSGAVSAASTAPLLIRPAAVSLVQGATQAFTLSGGTGSYSVTVPNNCGSIDPTTKIYTAPSANLSCTILASDSAGTTAQAVVTVTGGTIAQAPLSASYIPSVAQGSGTEVDTIIAQGGSGNYAYTKGTGAGTLSGNVYTTTASDESATILVSDGTTQVTVPITVGHLVPPTQTIYQLKNGNDYMLSTASSENGYAQFNNESFQTYTAGGGNRTQLYRVMVDMSTGIDGYFYKIITHTVSLTAAGSEGSLGFIEKTPTSVAQAPLYVCGGDFNQKTTRGASPCAAGGAPTLLGYVP